MTSADFGHPVNALWCFCSQKLLYYLTFQSFDFDRTSDYSSKASCALNLISTFVLLSLGRYLCWWSISPRGHHPSSSQYLDTDIVY